MGVSLTLVLVCALDACSSSPAPTPRSISKSTTTTTTAATTTTTVAAVATSTTTTLAGVAVPDVVGLKINSARFFLREAGFITVPLNAPCYHGNLNGESSLNSQSVVVSLSVPGNPPQVSVGAVPLAPGTSRPKGSRVGITWSGCFPGGSVVPEVTGLTFAAAVNLLHTAGLAWACYSQGSPTTTTTTAATTTTGHIITPNMAAHTSSSTFTASAPTSSTSTLPRLPRSTTTTTHPPTTVLSQGSSAGTVLKAGTPVAIAMYHCPQ